MSKKPRDVDLDEGIAPEKLPPEPERIARGTDAGWPVPLPPAPEAGPVGVEAILLELEARCDAGGSAGLADIRRVLKALRGA